MQQFIEQRIVGVITVPVDLAVLAAEQMHASLTM